MVFAALYNAVSIYALIFPILVVVPGIDGAEGQIPHQAAGSLGKRPDAAVPKGRLVHLVQADHGVSHALLRVVGVRLAESKSGLEGGSLHLMEAVPLVHPGVLTGTHCLFRCEAVDASLSLKLPNKFLAPKPLSQCLLCGEHC